MPALFNVTKIHWSCHPWSLSQRDNCMRAQRNRGRGYWCVFFLLKDRFISVFSSNKPVDRETENALRGSLLYQHIVICAALWLLLHCDYITAALWLYQVKCQHRDKVTLQHLLKVDSQHFNGTGSFHSGGQENEFFNSIALLCHTCASERLFKWICCGWKKLSVCMGEFLH